MEAKDMLSLPFFALKRLVARVWAWKQDCPMPLAFDFLIFTCKISTFAE
jgi:hypothetical protein